jgi:hypothetical protein
MRLLPIGPLKGPRCCQAVMFGLRSSAKQQTTYDAPHPYSEHGATIPRPMASSIENSIPKLPMFCNMQIGNGLRHRMQGDGTHHADAVAQLQVQ